MSNKIKRGIFEVGEIVGAEDVSFGKTTPDGISLNIELTELDIESGQDLLPVEIEVTAAKAQFSGVLIFSSLENFCRVFGLDADTALTGPAIGQEALEIANAALGQRAASKYYFKTAGVLGPRKVIFARAKLLPNGEITFGRDDIVRLPFKVRATATEDGSPAVTMAESA